MSNLSESCRQAGHKLFEQANEYVTAANLLIMASLELEEVEARLAKYEPKRKKRGADPRQRIFTFDLDRFRSWADIDKEIEELELKEKEAAAGHLEQI